MKLLLALLLLPSLLAAENLTQFSERMQRYQNADALNRIAESQERIADEYERSNNSRTNAILGTDVQNYLNPRRDRGEGFLGAYDAGKDRPANTLSGTEHGLRNALGFGEK
jgi:hypothetical protein